MLISHICSSVASLGVALRSKAAVAAMAKKSSTTPRNERPSAAPAPGDHDRCPHCNDALPTSRGMAGPHETRTVINEQRRPSSDVLVGSVNGMKFRSLATCSFCKIEWWTRAHRQTIMCQRCGAGPLCMECRRHGCGDHIDAQQCGSFCPTCVHRMKDGDGAGVAQGGACRRKKRKTCGSPAAPR